MIKKFTNTKKHLTLLLFILLVNCFAKAQCDNATNGGQIGPNQFHCGNSFDPSTIQNIISPSGGSGTFEYLWLTTTDSLTVSGNNSNYTAIPNSSSETYNPGVITQTTWYRRCVRRSGCSSYLVESNWMKVQLCPLPIANAGVDKNLDCITTSTQIGNPTISTYTYNWSPSTGLSATNIAMPIANPTTNTTYTLTITNECGCSSNDTVTVFSSTSSSIIKPSILSYPNNKYCFGANYILKAKGEINAVFNWDVPAGCPAIIDNSIAGESSIILSNLSSSCNGFFKVNQTISGCASSLYDSLLVDGGSKSTINFVTTSCVNGMGAINVNTTPSNGLEFSINGGVYQLSNILFANAGSTFFVTAKQLGTSCVASYTGECVHCTTLCTTLAKDSLVAPNVACIGTPIPLQNYITNASMATFTSSGTGVFSTTTCNSTTCNFTYTPSVLDLQKGNVVITATSNDPDSNGVCIAAVCSKNIILVNGLVAPTILSNSPICENSLLTFEAPFSIGNILWLANNGFSSTNNPVSITNASANMNGLLSLTLSAYGCASVSTSKNIVVVSLPTINTSITPHNEICAGHANGSIEVKVLGGSGNYTICYNGNLSNCTNNTNANFMYLAAGNYNITIVDQVCPSNIFSYPVEILPGIVVPTPTVSSTVDICANKPLILTGINNIPSSTINWIFPTTNFNATGNTIVRYNTTPTMSGIYFAKTIDSNGCASSSVPVNVSVIETPVINNVQINCISLVSSVNVLATISSNEPLLYSLDGINFQTSNIFNNYVAGNYILYVKKGINDCVATQEISIPNCACSNEPTVVINYPTISCGQMPITLLSSFTNVTNASWSSLGTGSIINSSGTSPLNTIYTPSANDLANGEVQLTLTTDDPDGTGNCTSTVKNILIKLVNSIPQPSIQINQTNFCMGDTIILTTNSNLPVEWFGPAGFHSTKSITIIPTVTVINTGDYSVKISGNGCDTKTDTMQINVANAPTLTVSTNVVNENCEGHGNGEITVNITGGTGNYLVCNDFALNCHNITTSNYTYKYLSPAIYLIHVADISCPNNRTIIPTSILAGIHVDSPLSATSNSPVCEGNDLVLSASGSNSNTFLWTDMNNNYIDSGINIIRHNAEADMSGTYKVQQIVNGCASSPIYTYVSIVGTSSISSIDTNCINIQGEENIGQITVNAQINSNDSIEFSLNDGLFQTSNVFNNLSNGLYKVNVRAVGSDCITTVRDIELYCACTCNKEANISIYPNPNIGIFTLNATLLEESEDIDIQVLDLTGRTVYLKTMQSKAGVLKYPINIQSYSTGHYFIKMSIEKNNFILPFTVER